jgi:hypothetical protein
MLETVENSDRTQTVLLFLPIDTMPASEDFRGEGMSFAVYFQEKQRQLPS